MATIPGITIIYGAAQGSLRLSEAQAVYVVKEVLSKLGGRELSSENAVCMKERLSAKAGYKWSDEVAQGPPATAPSAYRPPR